MSVLIKKQKEKEENKRVKHDRKKIFDLILTPFHHFLFLLKQFFIFISQMLKSCNFIEKYYLTQNRTLRHLQKKKTDKKKNSKMNNIINMLIPMRWLAEPSPQLTANSGLMAPSSDDCAEAGSFFSGLIERLKSVGVDAKDDIITHSSFFAVVDLGLGVDLWPKTA